MHRSNLSTYLHKVFSLCLSAHPNDLMTSSLIIDNLQKKVTIHRYWVLELQFLWGRHNSTHKTYLIITLRSCDSASLIYPLYLLHKFLLVRSCGIHLYLLAILDSWFLKLEARGLTTSFYSFVCISKAQTELVFVSSFSPAYFCFHTPLGPRS